MKISLILEIIRMHAQINMQNMGEHVENYRDPSEINVSKKGGG